MSNDPKGILLESGTNELEVIVFSIGQGVFGINVMKVREIINPLPVTKMPNGHPNVEGIIRLRDEVLPVVNLAKVIGFPPSESPEQDKLIVAELNKMKVAFHVHNVSRIHRISWEQIEKPTKLSQGLEGSTIGVIKMEDNMILLLDYEKILVDISPSSGINKEEIKTMGSRERSYKKVMIVEDSPILRRLLEDTLVTAGYENLQFFEDGKLAWDHLEKIGKEKLFTQLPDVIISDIEMPKMDGHHLTKRIKDDILLKDIPVVIFSSLITGDLYHKGDRVGANAQVSKPEIVNLVENIDKLLA
ncbi:chemotaxis protein CheV [Anaerobacillus alkalidiazotrophicus]|uniref:Chemotaxis protein CheV n=1 Tax=Anaerobacillus alkalidiazotrophicus TaxID=472963 RepID=A0A1S2M2J6_9BACI|nr:chemotaxis protein [Anaerobacillus alkalidiazotrophicus]OIJ18961.1 chemotaxis protein CheV [Anaerobacillus alkalidiazotrophicus]